MSGETDKAAEKRGSRKVRTGVVTSDRQTKTIVVEVMRRSPHPLYMKVVKSRKKYYAHDEKEEAGIGDTVRIMESRPYSKLKRWRLVEVVRKAEQIEKVEAQNDTDAVKT